MGRKSSMTLEPAYGARPRARAAKKRDDVKMKKYKTIWIVILLIVMVGCTMTLSTRRIISKREGSSSLETAEPLQLDMEAGAAGGETSQENAAAPGSGAAQSLYGVSNAQARNSAPDMQKAGGMTGNYETGTAVLTQEDSADSAEWYGPAYTAPENELPAEHFPSEYLQADAMPQKRDDAEGLASGGTSVTTSGAASAAEKETADAENSYNTAVCGQADAQTKIKRKTEVEEGETAAASANQSSTDASAKTSAAAASSKLEEFQNREVLISPLTGDAESICEMEVSYEEEKERLSNRIADLEKRIADRWKDTDETMTAKMNTAEYERSMWEAEMLQTYSLLEGRLTEENQAKLSEQQTQWTKERNLKASETASRYEGSTRENLEYTKACSTLTKKRVLQLMNTYLDLLSESQLPIP